MTDPGPPSPDRHVALDYHEALAALATRGRFGIRMGLGRTRALLRALGDPQLAVRGALVAGTNGKGSVLALAGSALRAAGLRVGETPKPHLVTYRERVVIDGRPIGVDDFTRNVEAVLAVADRVARRHGDPTEFELLTAVVFRHFAEANLDLALVEVGLGGRLDATHAWDGGVAVVTNVDLDHMDRLGPTIAAIAKEKAAIIERGDIAVTGATGDALEVIGRRARRMAVPLTVVEPATLLGWDRDGIDVEVPGLGPTRVGLRGRHQAENVAVADALLDALEEAGIATVDPDARRRGYATAVWPGRLELLELGDGRDVLLDGAHNPAGAAALARALDDLRPHLAAGPLTLVTASMADKDVDGVVTALGAAEALRGASVIATSVDAPRAMPAARARRALAEPIGPRQRDRGPRAARGPRCRHGGPGDDGRRRLALSCGRGPCPSRRRPRSARPRSWSPRSMTAARRTTSADPAPIRIGPVTFAWGQRTYVMGILNVTPDSFSGDGLLEGDDPVERAVATARQMVADGADLLDIGGESTRPGHASVDATEELRRVIPVITALATALPDTPISVDTAKPEVAEAAIAAGAHLLNDVWGTGPDIGEMAAVAAARRRAADRHAQPSEARYERNVVTEVVADLGAALDRAIAAGVPEDDLIVDPGIGFGKTADHNISVLCHLGALSALGRPVLLGTSRKSTLGRILDLPVEERLEATLATTALGIAAGVDLVRVHDVAPNVRVARVSDAIVRGHWRNSRRHADGNAR